MDLLKIATDLQAIVDQLRGGAASSSAPAPLVGTISLVASPGEGDLKANWVRVHHPKGYRDYPNPQFVSNYKQERVDTITGYASAIQNEQTWNCQNYDYRRRGGELNQMSQENNDLLKQKGMAVAPLILDKLGHPDDYTPAGAVVDTRPWVPGVVDDKETTL